MPKDKTKAPENEDKAKEKTVKNLDKSTFLNGFYWRRRRDSKP